MSWLCAEQITQHQRPNHRSFISFVNLCSTSISCRINFVSCCTYQSSCHVARQIPPFNCKWCAFASINQGPRVGTAKDENGQRLSRSRREVSPGVLAACRQIPQPDAAGSQVIQVTQVTQVIHVIACFAKTLCFQALLQLLQCLLTPYLGRGFRPIFQPVRATHTFTSARGMLNVADMNTGECGRKKSCAS